MQIAGFRRSIVLAAGIAILAPLLSGCGGGVPPSEPPDRGVAGHGVTRTLNDVKQGL